MKSKKYKYRIKEYHQNDGQIFYKIQTRPIKMIIGGWTTLDTKYYTIPQFKEVITQLIEMDDKKYWAEIKHTVVYNTWS